MFYSPANKVALVISDSNIAIDIEEKNVPWKVAIRFYHLEELNFLNSLPSPSKKQMCQWLWKLKECKIKLNCVSLFEGINMDNSRELVCLYNDIERLNKKFYAEFQWIKILIGYINLKDKFLIIKT